MSTDETTPNQVLSMNQVVSFNLMRARRRKGWTQEELADRLIKATGRHWTNATLSNAERTWATGRTREFNADDLFAFSHVFDVPVTHFFEAPDAAELEGVRMSFAKDVDPDGDDARMVTPEKWSLGEGIAAQIRRYRRLRDISVRELADECEKIEPGTTLTQGALTNVERGPDSISKRGRRDLTLDELVIVAAALRVTPIELAFPGELVEVEYLPGEIMPTSEAIRRFGGMPITAEVSDVAAPSLSTSPALGTQLAAVARMAEDLLEVSANLVRVQEQVREASQKPQRWVLEQRR